jgi:branched-chain amino acid transport system substrate-binding protein
MADFTYNKLDIKKAAVLYVNNDFGQGLKEVFGKRVKELGGKILIAEPYEQGSTDFRAQLTKIKNKNPEGIYLPGYYQEVAKIAVQINEMGIKAKLLSTSPIENPDLIKLAKKAAENIIYTRPAFDPQNPSEKYKNFSQAFKEKYAIDCGIAAAFSYDAMGVILYSLEKLHAKDRLSGEMIQEVMACIKDYDGVTGKFSFDENGDVKRKIVLFTIKNGQFIPFSEETSNEK